MRSYLKLIIKRIVSIDLNNPILVNFKYKHFYTLKVILIKIINGKKDSKDIMINIGGGKFFRRHWRVLDFPTEHYSHSTYYIDYIFDLASKKPLPFRSNSVKFFYSSNTLEHIPQEFCQHIFNEIYRCLKKGGAVRLTMPDFDKAYEAYKNNNNKFFTEDGRAKSNLKNNFIKFFATYLLYDRELLGEKFDENFKAMKKVKFADYYTKKIPRNTQKTYPENHINWWNYKKAKKMLINSGFKNVYESTPQQSRFIELRGVGRVSGFDSTYPKICFFIEAVK